MNFEIKDKDLLARIGRLKTKTSIIETPLLFPVINPNIQPITPRKLKETFGFDAVITNAYILKKRHQNTPIQQGLHKFLDFNGTIMTDSGAYQILIYGEVDINQEEIIAYQENINTDIATMLDIPTGWKITKQQAAKTVNETLKRAKALLQTKTRDDILWVGPVQGGRHLNLVKKSAQAMGKLPFHIHALGSPTEVMENYRFDVLVDMIMTAKMNLPIERPLHLFGAGHPMMFALAVALGCDTFDSAAYALYARENRYMTENGTWRLDEMDYFPCQCPKCSNQKPQEIMAKPPKERETFLAEHNLHVCKAELNRIKQAIRDGRLWEHMEMRAHAHPALFTAVKKLKNYAEFIEKHSPTTKRSGMFFYSTVGLARPEVTHYKKQLLKNYYPPLEAKTLLLAPQTRTKPFHKARGFKKISKTAIANVHVCFYAAPFGVIPSELDEVYPLSQHETSLPLDNETIKYVAKQVAEYIQRTHYKTVVLLHDPQTWGNNIKKTANRTCQKKGVTFEHIDIKAKSTKNILTRIDKILKKNLSE
ncbi:MAG: tRNA guanosine(15) transglycosylase TgtA [Candidatus Bathyarchaeia archaeon]